MGLVKGKDMEIGVMAEPNWVARWLVPQSVIMYENWLIEEMQTKVQNLMNVAESEDSTLQEFKDAAEEAWEVTTMANGYLQRKLKRQNGS